MTDSTEVIARRTASIADGTMSLDEVQRMITEKPLTFANAMHSATLALMQGSNPLWVAQSAIVPIQARTADNAERLRPIDD